MTKLPPTLVQSDPTEPSVPVLHEIATQAAPATLGHALKAHSLLNNRTTRLVNNGLVTAGLATHLMDPQVWEESLQLQKAVMVRLQQQNQDWLKGCAILMQDYAQIKQANTMSKLVEKQCNLVTQWSQLLTSQATNLMGLMENIEVDYGYWVSQKVRSPRPGQE